MRGKELERDLRQYLQQGTGFGREPERDNAENPGVSRLEETVKLCTEMMREQKLAKKSREEPRIGFARYLSEIFRFEGVLIFGLQAAALSVICGAIYAVAGNPSYIPAFTSLFVLAVVPAMFRCQYYGMSEMEAVTRASGSQIVLAKLILAGAANLVGMTFFVFFEAYLQESYGEIGQIILYCLVPYLVCMAGMLRLIRLCRKEAVQIGMGFMLGFYVCWGVSARTLPWLYDVSAFGIWIVAFLSFAVFFIKEVHFIVTVRREGKMYGIIA